jgi:hypothetical protein
MAADPRIWRINVCSIRSRTMLEKTTAFVCIALGATLSIARADTEPEADPGTAPHAATTSSAAGTDQLTLPKGRLLLNAFFEANLGDGKVFNPISISPDIWYGATDKLTIGLVHSGVGGNGFIGSVGDSLCLSSKADGCADVYHNVGLDVRYGLKAAAPLSYAVDAGLYASALDPDIVLAVKLGFSGRWRKDKLAVEFQPNVFIGVTQRDSNNEEFLNVPVTALYSINPKLALALQAGVIIPFKDTGDTFAVPVSIGAQYFVNESLGFNLAFSLPRLVAGTAPDTFDARTLTVGATYAF